MGKYIIKERYNEKENRKEEAIFYVDDNGNEIQISKWWKKVYSYGLVDGRSDYYIVKRDDNKEAIFHKDDKENPISGWWKNIYIYGLIEGESNYYIVKRDDDNEAIFHKDDKENPISKWWRDIYNSGLVKGESEYYIARRDDDNKRAIFHKNFKNFPVFISNSREEAQDILNEIEFKDLSPLEAFLKYNNLC